MTVHDIHLAGPDIRLDPLQPEDAYDLFGLIDADLWRGMPTPLPADADAFARHIETLQSTPGLQAFAVRDAVTGEARGSTAFYDLVPQQRRVEIGGTWYSRPYWGGRTNPAAKLLLLRHAFESLELNRVALRCDVRNERSAAAIQRLGAQPEGVLRAHRIAADGVVSATAYFSILRDEWPDVKAGLSRRLGCPV